MKKKTHEHNSHIIISMETHKETQKPAGNRYLSSKSLKSLDLNKDID